MADKAKAKANTHSRCAKAYLNLATIRCVFPGLGDHQQLTPEEAKKERRRNIGGR